MFKLQKKPFIYDLRVSIAAGMIEVVGVHLRILRLGNPN